MPNPVEKKPLLDEAIELQGRVHAYHKSCRRDLVFVTSLMYSMMRLIVRVIKEKNTDD